MNYFNNGSSTWKVLTIKGRRLHEEIKPTSVRNNPAGHVAILGILSYAGSRKCQFLRIVYVCCPGKNNLSFEEKKNVSIAAEPSITELISPRPMK